MLNEAPQGTAYTEYVGPEFLRPLFDRTDGLFDRVTKIQIIQSETEAPPVDFTAFKHLEEVKDDAWAWRVDSQWTWDDLDNDTTQHLKQAYSECQMSIQGSQKGVLPTIKIDAALTCCNSTN